MPEPRYRGESWQASILRANLEAAAERRAAEQRAEREAEAKRARRRPASAAKPTPPPPPAETPRERAPRALGWRALTPDELRRF